ncbi:MAG: hypothetical protein AB7F75_02780 [Planctomycetota bacterium]
MTNSPFVVNSDWGDTITVMRQPMTRMKKWFIGLAMAFVAALPSHLIAQSLETIDQINLGSHIYGAPIDKKSLMGKVVVMELWGMG